MLELGTWSFQKPSPASRTSRDPLFPQSKIANQKSKISPLSLTPRFSAETIATRDPSQAFQRFPPFAYFALFRFFRVKKIRLHYFFKSSILFRISQIL
jgi:hypothetical protein